MKIMIFEMKILKRNYLKTFTSFWSENTETIIKNKKNNINSNYNIIQSITLLYFILFLYINDFL